MVLLKGTLCLLGEHQWGHMSMSHYYSDQSYHYDLSHLNYYLQAHMNQNKLNNISFEGEFTTNFCHKYFILSNLVNIATNEPLNFLNK